MFDLINNIGKKDKSFINGYIASSFPFILDQINLALKRANLIIAEHVLVHELNSDTRQILNCSLRESSIVYERIAKNFKPTIPLDCDLLKKGLINKLKILLGELEGDLPMHAQFIHEVIKFLVFFYFYFFKMVLRHGPQLNEQLHKIAGQPQVVNLNNRDFKNNENNFLNSYLYEYFKHENSEEFLSHISEKTSSNIDIFNPNISSTKGFNNIINNINVSPKSDLIKKLPIEIKFEICLAGIELNARLLSTLKARYTLRKAMCYGNRFCSIF